MNSDLLWSYGPYSLPVGEKRALFAQVLTQLTEHHRQACPAYGRFLRAIGWQPGALCTPETVPMLPVSIFKELELRSVPEEAVFKTLTSSGTTGQKVSRILLDASTAAHQQRVLAAIMADLLGPTVCPTWCWTAGGSCGTGPCFPPGGRGSWAFPYSAPAPATPWMIRWSWICPGCGPFWSGMRASPFSSSALPS